MIIAEEESANFEIFKDCLSTTIIQKLAPDDKSGGKSKKKKKKKVKGRKNEIKPVVRSVEEEEEEEGKDAAELGDFVEYLAEEIFPSLPSSLRTLSYSAMQNDPIVKTTYTVPLDTHLLETLMANFPPSVPDSLTSYSLLPSPSDLDKFLESTFTAYLTSTTSPPPEHTPSLLSSRPSGCEICEREHLPLTYHHLIPRAMHAKSVKRGWHREWELGKVAWLCRACHSFVHGIEGGNEVLARELWSVELLMEREDVRRWAGWVGKVRWKAR